MAYDIPTSEPTEVTAGDLVTWTRPEHSSFTLADSWVLSYALVMAGNRIVITSSDNGDQTHLIAIAAATTAAWAVGTYKWQAYVTNGVERYNIDEGSIKVLTDFAAATTGHDARTHWKIVLDNVEAVIQGRATKDQSSYTISGRQLSRTPVADLILLYNRAKSAVAAEEQAERIENGLGTSGKISVRF